MLKMQKIVKIMRITVVISINMKIMINYVRTKCDEEKYKIVGNMCKVKQ